jgi:hypothetical protein
MLTPLTEGLNIMLMNNAKVRLRVICLQKNDTENDEAESFEVVVYIAMFDCRIKLHRPCCLNKKTASPVARSSPVPAPKSLFSVPLP